MKNYSYQKPKMTTALAIKCKDGIVLASESQGTQYNSIKMPINKVFKINKYIGLAGAEKDEWTRYVVDYLRKITEKYESERELTDYLNKHICKLHKEKNKPEHVIINQESTSSLNFAPELLIGTKLKDDEFYIHHVGFCMTHELLINNPPTIEIIYEYKVMGSGSITAIESLEKLHGKLKPLDMRISELPVEINVGIAMHAISQAKETDLFSGGDTQIGIIDNAGFRKISLDEQSTYYHKTIKDLSKLLNEEESKIKEFLPVRITILL